MATGHFNRKSNGQSDFTLPPSSDPIFCGSLALHEALVGYIDDDNKHKPGCRLSISVQGAYLKVCFNDPVTNTFAYANLDPAKPLGAALAEVCESGGIEWQNSRGKRS